MIMLASEITLVCNSEENDLAHIKIAVLAVNHKREVVTA
jgi:hypothetical protein